MTGRTNVTKRTNSGWLDRLRKTPHSYFAIDGGSGAHLLAALTERNLYVKQVASPRHANVLLIVEPISQKLAPAVVEMAKALPRPAHALVVGDPQQGEPDHLSETELAHVEDFLPHALRISQASVEAVLNVMLHPERWTELISIDRPEAEATTIRIPSKQEQEVATELVVLSLGPIQPFTAGPLRIFLVCDGEQVLSAQVEAGYAHRDIAQAMTQADWQHSLQLARCLDPLAPVASQLAYVSVIEQLQNWWPSAQLETLRQAALALERAQNALWWLVRFAKIVADIRLVNRSYQLATGLAASTSQLWQQPPIMWMMPQRSISAPAVIKNTSAIPEIHRIADGVEVLGMQAERNRLLGIRTRSIGVLATERLKAANVSGPVLQASEHGNGDVQSRLVIRLQNAARDLREVAGALSTQESIPTQEASWDIPVGEAKTTIRGPRGDIGLHLVSSNREKPASVEWQRPSALLLPLLPEILAGQKLADAEVIVASLDLAMAEADG